MQPGFVPHFTVVALAVDVRRPRQRDGKPANAARVPGTGDPISLQSVGKGVAAPMQALPDMPVSPANEVSPMFEREP